MSDNIAETFEFEHGIKGYVKWDSDCIPEMYDPREWENIGVMLTAHSRYTLGDVSDSSINSMGQVLGYIMGEEDIPLYCSKCKREVLSDDFEEWYHADSEPEDPDEDTIFCDGERVVPFNDDELVIMPLYLFDHSGLSISTSDTMFRMADSAGWDWGIVGVIYTTMKRMQDAGLLTDDDNEMTWQNKAREILTLEVKTYDLYLTGQCYGYEIEDAEGDILDACWGFLGDDSVEAELKAAAEYYVNKLASEQAAANLPININL